MNLRRSLSSLQMKVMKAIASREQVYNPAKSGYACLCGGKGLGLRPGQWHIGFPHGGKAIKNLQQRGLLTPDKEGFLVTSGEAAKVFPMAAKPPATRLVTMSRTRAARTQP